MNADDQNASGKMKRIVEGQNRNRVEYELVCEPRGGSKLAKRVGNVLVIDDEVAMCEILSLYFEFKGLSVSTSQTPAEALDALTDAQFDLAIIDWDLAGLESLDLLNYFKATRPEMAVIIFTGKETDESFLKKALEGRADAVLPKLGSLESLWQHISTHLEKGSTQSSPSRLDRSRSDARDV